MVFQLWSKHTRAKQDITRRWHKVSASFSHKMPAPIKICISYSGQGHVRRFDRAYTQHRSRLFDRFCSSTWQNYCQICSPRLHGYVSHQMPRAETTQHSDLLICRFMEMIAAHAVIRRRRRTMQTTRWRRRWWRWTLPNFHAPLQQLINEVRKYNK